MNRTANDEPSGAARDARPAPAAPSNAAPGRPAWEAAAAAETAAPDPPVRALRNALMAPWAGLIDPARAARRLVRASAGGVAACLLVYAGLIAAAVLLLALWAGTLRAEMRIVPVAQSGPAAGVVVGTPFTSFELVRRDLLEVWRDWHAQGVVGPAEYGFVGVFALVGVLAGFGAWLHLPFIHRAGPVGPSVHRALAATVACVGILLVLTVAGGGLIVTMFHLKETRIGLGRGAWVLPIAPEIVIVLTAAAAVCSMLFVVGRAARAAGDAVPGVALPPQCEGCGYNLARHAHDARCPECGLAVAESLSAARRPGCAWEALRTPAAWLVSSLGVLLAPRGFYERLRLRTSERAARRFAAAHLALIWTGAAGWMLLMLATGLVGPPNRGDAAEIVSVALAISLLVLAAAVGIQRLVVATAMSWAIYVRGLPDFAWGRRVIDYESAWLWTFCALNGLVLSAAMLETGLGRWMFRARFLHTGLTVGEACMFLGNVGLGLLWLWRYRVALRAIRWSNY